MPIVTLQIGQCGNQLGRSLFQTLSANLCTQDGWQPGHETFFRSASDEDPAKRDKLLARSVLVDMEPKVIEDTRAFAKRSGHGWMYSDSGWVCQQSGAGNNWALGYYGYGPRVQDRALELIRREAEHCDYMEGFLMIQSMAGGTGAGFGTKVSEAVRDEYPNSFRINACVWPYQSGEVIVQSYNTLLTLTHLCARSDGIILMQNEDLHSTCQRLYGLSRPSFEDMNQAAAVSLASCLLPARCREAAGLTPSLLQRAHHTQPTLGAPQNANAAGSTVSGRRYRPLPDIAQHLCFHPSYKIMSLRQVPQVPAQNIDFTTFTWAAILRRLRQMFITGSGVEEGMDWSNQALSPPPLAPRSGPVPRGTNQHPNRALAAMLMLRGQHATQVDVQDFAAASHYPAWNPDPLSVKASLSSYNRCLMSSALLATDQAAAAPLRDMQDRAYVMLSAGAYVHQYQKYGMELQEFHECFAQVEEAIAQYALL